MNNTQLLTPRPNGPPIPGIYWDGNNADEVCAFLRRNGQPAATTRIRDFFDMNRSWLQLWTALMKPIDPGHWLIWRQNRLEVLTQSEKWLRYT